MNRCQLLLVCLLLLAALMLAPQAAQAEQDSRDYAPGQVLVKLRDGAAIGQVGARYGALVAGRLGEGDTFLLRLPPGLAVNRVLQQMQGDLDLTRAEANYTFWTPEIQGFILDFGDQLPTLDPDPAASPDQRYLRQWAAAKIGLTKAFESTRGEGVVVAVLDTGVDFSHPVLAGRLLEGRDFVDGDNNPLDEPNGRAAGHGTFVSGIVALVAPDSKILPVRVLNSSGSGTLFDVARGIVYAADQGAGVVNLSLGTYRDSRTLEEAVRYAAARGAVVVASVGNQSTQNHRSTLLYPARYDEVAAVAATDADDLMATFSNWGKKTDLCAPGVNIYSSYLGGSYAWWSGTSPSAAFVSGAAALLRAQHPAWDASQVSGRLEGTAVNIDALNDPRLRGKLGAGRIDLEAATRPGS